MPEDRAPVREIMWAEVFPWLKLAGCLRLALQIGAILLAAAGMLATVTGWKLIGQLYRNSEDPLLTDILARNQQWPWDWNTPATAGTALANSSLWGLDTVSLWEFPLRLVAPFFMLFNERLTLVGFTYGLLCAVWALAVWSIFGAALTRMAALALTREEKIGPVTALIHGIRRWSAYFGGPALPILGCLLIGLAMSIPGLLARSDFGATVVAIFWPLSLMLGLLMALLLIGLLLGWPLMWPTISVEGTEPFDAISRAYSYTYHRPLRYLFYVAFATLLGALGLLVVEAFASATVSLAYWGLTWGGGVERINALADASVKDTGEGMFGFAARTLMLWNGLVKLFAASFAASFFWSAATAIYLLLRRDEDGAEMEEVYVEGETESYGLPPLKTDAAGVPTVQDLPSASSEQPAS